MTNLPKRKCRDSKKVVLGVGGIDHDRPIELQEASRKSGILPTLKIFKDPSTEGYIIFWGGVIPAIVGGP